MKNLFVLHIILTFVWAAVMGALTITTLIVGYVLGYFVLIAISPAIDDEGYIRKTWKIVAFAVFFVKELFMSSIRVAIDILKPSFKMRSGIIAIPLDAKTDLEITFLANVISLTPGTLSLDVSDDKKTLYVHSMYIDKDVDTVRQDIKNTMERRILEITR